MIRFVMPIVPTPQARARHAVRNGFSTEYKSPGQKANERTLEAYLVDHAPDAPLTGALELTFIAVFPVPKSRPKKDRTAMLRGEIGHTSKPDLDNLAKQLKDAMTRAQFWGDDKQIVRLNCVKRYGERGQWQVMVRQVGQ